MNGRNDLNDLPRKRKKLGTSLNWYKRRRGGNTETSRKENGWKMGVGVGGGRGVSGRNPRSRNQTDPGKPGTQVDGNQPQKERQV